VADNCGGDSGYYHGHIQVYLAAPNAHWSRL